MFYSYLGWGELSRLLVRAIRQAGHIRCRLAAGTGLSHSWLGLAGFIMILSYAFAAKYYQKSL
jgi:hypothetical protein